MSPLCSKQSTCSQSREVSRLCFVLFSKDLIFTFHFHRQKLMIVRTSRVTMMKWRLMINIHRLMSRTMKNHEWEIFARNDQRSFAMKRRLCCRCVWNTCTKFWRGKCETLHLMYGVVQKPGLFSAVCNSCIWWHRKAFCSVLHLGEYCCFVVASVNYSLH